MISSETVTPGPNALKISHLDVANFDYFSITLNVVNIAS